MVRNIANGKKCVVRMTFIVINNFSFVSNFVRSPQFLPPTPIFPSPPFLSLHLPSLYFSNHVSFSICLPLHPCFVLSHHVSLYLIFAYLSLSFVISTSEHLCFSFSFFLFLTNYLDLSIYYIGNIIHKTRECFRKCAESETVIENLTRNFQKIFANAVKERRTLVEIREVEMVMVDTPETVVTDQAYVGHKSIFLRITVQ